MTDASWEPRCILCAARGHERKLEEGHCCSRCSQWLTSTLCTITTLAAAASEWIEPRPRPGAGSSAFGPRSPINLDALDPELATLELVPGDESSAVTILEMLESWERAIRDDRGYVPYGPASSARASHHAWNTTATMSGVVDFLISQNDWITSDPGFDLETYADHLRRAAAILRRWQEDEQIGTRIACPAQLDERTCGTPIRVSSDGTPVVCRGCGHSWTVEWLIRVAGEEADGWADLESVSRLSKLSERTIRRWAAAGKVARRGQLYNIRDIANAVDKEISA